MRRAALSALLGWLVAAAAAAAPEAPACGAAHASWRRTSLGASQLPDLRFLNDAPAGRHGFLKAQREALVFDDGTPARFWGVNVSAGAIFESPDAAIDEHAARLARLGVNLVRLHHHDSGAWLRRTLISPRPGELLDPAALRKLDRWVARLKQQGIYVWLDLHTGRVFREDEGIPGFAELSRGATAWPSAKGFLYLNPRLEELVLRFAGALLDHRNEFTGLRYRDEPAVAALLVTNENDVAHHFGNLFAADRGNAWHRARFLEAATEFAARAELPVAKLERTWEAGPSKLLLADLEHRFDERARAHLRARGARVPIVRTSYWGRSALHALASLSTGELVDVHAYAHGDVLRGDPRRQLGFLGWIGAGQLVGKPVSVSEWNFDPPVQERRFEAPLWVASVAALQDWDALMLYAYAQAPLVRPSTRRWNAAIDPATIALMPAASLILRRGDVSSARQRRTLAPSREDVFFRDDHPGAARAISTLVEQSRIALALPSAPELPWLAPPSGRSGATIRDLSRSQLPETATRVRSDTGELERDFARGILRIDTPRTQAAAGALATRAVALSRVRIAAGVDAAVAFSSLDGEPLERSRRILVSVAGRACSPGPRATEWAAEPVTGSASLRTEGPRRLVPIGVPGAERPLERRDGEVVVPLDFGASWALLEPPARGAATR